MRRVGSRGGNDWEVVSWDEAYDIVGEQMALATRKYGPYSIMVGAGGGGTYGNVFQRVTQDAIGAPVCISGGGCQCYLPADCAGQWMRGGSNNRHEGNNAREMWNAWQPAMECVVLWGAQTSASGAAYAARANAEMRERGIKTIVIDPYYTEEAAKADIKSGKLVVFTGPIKDQKGVERIPTGMVPSDKELLGMDWFVEGVIGTID